MGAPDRTAPWERERHVTDALEAVALVVRAIAGLAGVSLAGLEPQAAPGWTAARLVGPDQRWRGASLPVGPQLVA